MIFRQQTKMPATSDLPDDVLDQAINWLVKLRSGRMSRAHLESSIAAWRAIHPQNDIAWQELQASEAEFERLIALPMPSGQLLNALDNVKDGRARHDGRRRALLFTLGITGLGIGALAAQYGGLGISGDYVTAVGERRTVVLSDDTRVALNTDSTFQVRYDAERRALVLKHGEIFVSTGKDAAASQHRPFWVQTAQASLQALGTQFVVRQDGRSTRLTVTEGRVAVHVAGQLMAVAHPGDIVVIDDKGGATKVDAAGLTIDPTGWIDNALVVKNMRLDDFIQELARYRRGWLHCDPAVADLKVSGVFQIDDSDVVLDSLPRAVPVIVERRTRYWVNIASAGVNK